ncbi:A disintegrin and metalloproteinase with thrombospondin motifs adt-2-like isoform X2 [Linepithema humile]|uniref:A disintegrin and metalloproteinase with thrombospondin motifs adt-2-like isoform X2 n=1 Tax=Linepithema humile TaxID=83485 RepID=UPI00351E7B44
MRISSKISKQYCCRHSTRQTQKRNDQIASPEYEIWQYHIKGATEKLSQLKASDPCLYIYKDRISSAIINFCDERGLEGLIFLKNDTLEIRPLWNDLVSMSLVDDICVGEQVNLSFGIPHLIKRSLQYSVNSNLYHVDNFKPKRRYVRNTIRKLTIKLAVFLDAEAYTRLGPIVDYNEEKLHNMILAYVNQIQAVFHHPSLGVSIDISLVHLDTVNLREKYTNFGGEITKMSKSFCDYAETYNPPYDNNSRHWDVALILTSINIFFWSKSENKTERKFSIMANSSFNAVCEMGEKSCAIVEFAVNDRTISAGFGSSLLAVEEIGNILGMDSSLETCPRFKRIHSDEKYIRNQTTWAKCCRPVAENLWNEKPCLRDRTRSKNYEYENKLDHSRYHDLPGREWTAKVQCELFLLDKNANVVTLLDICRILQCETPTFSRYNNFFAGPALDGTYCAPGKECRRGKCVPLIEPPYIFKYCDDDNWSEWEEGTCQSGCLKNSKGVMVKRRYCKHGIHRMPNCGGLYYDVVLCNDSTLCFKNRVTIEQFTTVKCTLFKRKKMLKNLTVILKEKPGSQALHDFEKPWKACTIYCQQKKSPIFYAPRLEMLNYGINPYFPDGTWCHTDENGQNYYCRQYYCLPENYLFEE